MSNQIVERLRSRITGPASCDVRGEITADLRDAADEIDRLTRERDSANDYMAKIVDASTAVLNERDRLRAEVERLTYELEQATLVNNRLRASWNEDVGKARAERDEACSTVELLADTTEERDSLRDALGRYGQHWSQCPAKDNLEVACNCGYAEWCGTCRRYGVGHL